MFFFPNSIFSGFSLMCIVQVLGDLLQKCSYGWIYVLKSSALRSCFLEDILMGSGPTGFHKVISLNFLHNLKCSISLSLRLYGYRKATVEAKK